MTETEIETETDKSFKAMMAANPDLELELEEEGTLMNRLRRMGNGTLPSKPQHTWYRVDGRDAKHHVQPITTEYGCPSYCFRTQEEAQASADAANEKFLRTPHPLNVVVEGSDYPFEAPLPRNQSLIFGLKKLREAAMKIHKLGAGEIVGDCINGEYSITYYIDEILLYGSSVKHRRFQLDQRIFDWVQALAPKFHARLIEDRQEWLAQMAAKKNVVWLKNYHTR